MWAVRARVAVRSSTAYKIGVYIPRSSLDGRLGCDGAVYERQPSLMVGNGVRGVHEEQLLFSYPAQACLLYSPQIERGTLVAVHGEHQPRCRSGGPAFRL